MEYKQDKPLHASKHISSSSIARVLISSSSIATLYHLLGGRNPLEHAFFLAVRTCMVYSNSIDIVKTNYTTASTCLSEYIQQLAGLRSEQLVKQKQTRQVKREFTINRQRQLAV